MLGLLNRATGRTPARNGIDREKDFKKNSLTEFLLGDTMNEIFENRKAKK